MERIPFSFIRIPIAARQASGRIQTAAFPSWAGNSTSSSSEAALCDQSQSQSAFERIVTPEAWVKAPIPIGFSFALIIHGQAESVFGNEATRWNWVSGITAAFAPIARAGASQRQ